PASRRATALVLLPAPAYPVFHPLSLHDALPILTVPVLVSAALPSPQLMLTVKSVVTAPVKLSSKVARAMRPVAVPSVWAAIVGWLAYRATTPASATVTALLRLLVRAAEPLPSSV